MALPSSGPLSFQQIATELGVNPPLSLASMSTTAGFTPPYAVSNFYGYGGAPDVVTNGLKVYLDAGQTSSYSGSGSAWNDISGNNNNVTLQNSPTFSSSDGGSIVFNGASQYGTGTDLDLDYITIQVWVKSTGFGNNGYVVNKNYNGATVPYSLSLGNTQFGTTNGMAFHSPPWYASLVNTNIMNSNTWYNITGTFDGTTLKYYVNGVLNSSSTPAVNILPKNDNPFTIGAYLNDSAYFIGNMSSVLMYNRALTDTEIVQNYNAFASRFGYTPLPILNGLVMNLDAGNPASYSGTGSTWYDLTANGNNATLINSPTYSSSNNGILTFNGSNQYADLGNPASLNNLSVFTVSSWLQLNSLSVNAAQSIYGQGFDNVNEALAFRFLSGPSFNIGTYNSSTGNRGTTSGATFSTGTWYNLVGQYTGTAWTLYINGSLSSSTTSAGINSTTAPISIAGGYFSGTYARFLNGNISNVLVYNTALTSGQILQNYNTFAPRFGLPPIDIVTDGLVLNLDAGNPDSYSGTGSTWYDLSTSGNNATFINNPTYSSGNGGAIVFNGSNNYATLGNPSSLNILNFTIGAWIKSSSFANYENPIFKGDNTQGQYGIIINSSGNWGIQPNYAFTSSQIYLNTWTYIVGTYDGSQVTTYKDGIQISQYSIGQAYHGTEVTIGADIINNRYFNGYIAISQIYNRPLSPTEILQNYNVTKGRFGL
jgi:Concanavalin A-like lectin/glucanases superfamily